MRPKAKSPGLPALAYPINRSGAVDVISGARVFDQFLESFRPSTLTGLNGRVHTPTPVLRLSLPRVLLDWLNSISSTRRRESTPRMKAQGFVRSSGIEMTREELSGRPCNGFSALRTCNRAHI